MKIEIEYSTQVRAASGQSRTTLDVPGECTVADALAQLLMSNAKLAPWIETSGRARPGLLVFVNDQSPGDLHQTPLKPDDHIALMAMVSGG